MQFDYIDLRGKPFVRGARGSDAYDCYGLVRVRFDRSGVTVPDFKSPGTLEEVAELISSNEKRWRPVPIDTPGALITFRVEGIGAHVGFGLGDDEFIHAIEPNGVAVERLTGGLFKPLAAYLYE